MKSVEYNAQTGEITERELTPQEIAEMEAMQVEVKPESQPTIEEKVTELQQVIAELTTILNDKGIAP